MASQPTPGSTGGGPRIPAALSAQAIPLPRVLDFISSPILPRDLATPPLAGMPSRPLPGSTGGCARTPALFQPVPGGSPRTPAVFAPGSTGGTLRIPAALSAQAVPCARKIPILVDWWLEKVEGEEGKIRVAGTTFTPQMMSPLLRKGASSSKGNRNLALARRVFRSSAIVKHHDLTTIESEDGYHIRLGGLLNAPKSRESGFSEEVCECFHFGFQDLWQEVINPKLVPDNEHAQSPSETTTGAPSPSVEDYMAEFLSDSFSSSIRYGVTENNFESFVGYSGNIDGLTTQSLWNLLDDNAGNITASWGLHDLRMHVPEKRLAPPREACNSGQETYQHESTQIDASKQGIESTGRRLRSGKVLGMASCGPMKGDHEQKKIQLNASSKQMVNQGATSTADLTSHENDFSAAEVVVDEKLESHDSCRKGRGRPKGKKNKRKWPSAVLFRNWM